MRNVIAVLAAAMCGALTATDASAARATECTALNICYCVEQDLKPAIDANVTKIRKLMAEQKAAGKAVGYLSIPISTVGGSYFGVSSDVAARTKAAVEKRLGANSAWLLNPGRVGLRAPGRCERRGLHAAMDPRARRHGRQRRGFRFRLERDEVMLNRLGIPKSASF